MKATRTNQKGQAEKTASRLAQYVKSPHRSNTELVEGLRGKILESELLRLNHNVHIPLNNVSNSGRTLCKRSQTNNSVCATFPPNKTEDPDRSPSRHKIIPTHHIFQKCAVHSISFLIHTAYIVSVSFQPHKLHRPAAQFSIDFYPTQIRPRQPPSDSRRTTLDLSLYNLPQFRPIITDNPQFSNQF